jgi:hypothetical protein
MMSTDKEAITQNLDFEKYYRQQLPSLKLQGHEKAVALCPFHDDKNPSLSIKLDTGVFNCFGCSEHGSAIDFHMKVYGLSYPSALVELAHFAGISGDTRKKEIQTVYDYRDETGSLLFQTVRYSPKGFAQRKPDGNGGWIWNLAGVRLLPYNLQDVINAEKVLVVEGERDSDALKSLGLVASTSPLGAGKWRPDYNRYFLDKDVVIIPDNDEPGRQHALSVANNLKEVAKTIKIVNLPGLSDKGDVTDWMEDHNSADLLTLIDSTGEWPGEQCDLTLYNSLPSGADLQNMEVKVEWIVEGLIPKQSVTTFAGKGGVGKSYLLMGMADAVSKGEPFLGLTTQQAKSIYVDFENPLPVNIQRSRNLDVKKVKFWHNGMELKPPRIDSPEFVEYFKLPPSVLIFDSLRAAQSGDENDSRDMALAMGRYKELRDRGFTVILIIHTQKANERMFRGSMAIFDQADHVLNFYPVRNIKSDKAVDDDDDGDIGDLPFYLGTKEKTRYDRFQIYVKRAGGGRFTIAEDPKFAEMRELQALLKDSGSMNQTEIMKLAKSQLNYGKPKVRTLLHEGIGRFWTVIAGNKGARIYSCLDEEATSDSGTGQEDFPHEGDENLIEGDLP